MVGSRHLLLGVLAALLLLAAAPARAQKSRPGILRSLIDNLTPDTPEQMENEAIATRDASEARKLYGSLLARHPDSPEGVRAAIWIGLYSYAAGDGPAALEYFERARKHAKDPGLKGRAEFWCETVRLGSGAEPLPDPLDVDRADSWAALSGMVRVDRSIRAGRPGEGEEQLLALEGAARRSGLLGLLAARWGSLLAQTDPGRAERESLLPLERAVVGLPEAIYFRRSPAPTVKSEPEESWSVQFGAFLEEPNAKEMLEQLDRKGCDARIDEEEQDGQRWYRVRLGELPARAAAESLAAQVTESSGLPSEIVRIR